MKHPARLSHTDVLHSLSREIAESFEQLGAIPPDLSELYASDQWRYCQTEDKKAKGKVGYLCHYEWKNGRPRVIILIHSFRSGGELVRFDSQRYVNKQSTLAVTPERRSQTTTTEQQRRQQKAKQEAKRKRQRYQQLLQEWHQGTDLVLLHGYVLTKHIEQIGDLRLISQNRLAYPLYTMAGEIEGLQTIDGNGSKRIHGKKKGNYGILGDLESATRLYLCEGFSTASTIYSLVEACQKRKSPFAVIIGMDASNLKTVAKQFKTEYPEKKLVICPDNDGLKLSADQRHLPNAGLLSGFEAAIETYSELKVLPDFFQGSDWNDAWLENKDLAIEAFAKKKPIRLTDYTQERLYCFKREDNSISLKKATVKALYTAAQLYPAKLQEKDFLPAIIKATQHTKLTEQVIRHWWTRIKRRRFAMAMRTKSIAKNQSQQVIIQTLPNMQAIHTAVQTLKQAHPKAIFITNAPMGTGKTKDFMQPEFMTAEIKGQIPIVVTPTKALTKSVAERFKASHYLDDEMKNYHKGELVIPDSLAITVNSIIQERYHNILPLSRTLFIDEYTQVLRSITQGTVENHQRQTTEQRLATLMQQSHYTYIADADFNQIALEHVQSIVGDSVPIFLFSLEEPKEKPKLTYQCYQDNDPNFSNKWMLKIITDAAKQGQKLYIASDSKTQLECLEKALQQDSISTLTLTSDTINFVQQRAFLNRPNDYLATHQPQVVLVSPTIQSGVSIEVDYFERCFGIYAGTVTPVVFQQMLHRVRTQTCFEISLPNLHGFKHKDTENSAAMLMAAYQQHIHQFGGTTHITFDPKTKCHTIGSLHIKEKGGQITIEGEDSYCRYEKLCAELRALDNQQANQAANFLLLQALARKIHLEYKTADLKAFSRDLIKAEHKLIKEGLEQEKIHTVLTASILDDETYQQKKQKRGTTTPTEQHALERYEIVTALNTQPNELNEIDVAFYQENGPKKIANYQALLQGKDKANKNDTDDKENGVAKMDAKWRSTKVELLTVLFNTLEINPHTGAGEYTKTKAKKARRLLSENEAINRYITFKLQLQVNSHLPDITFVNKLLKRLLGLKFKRKQIREEENRYWVYEFDPIAFYQLKHYHNQRYERSPSTSDISGLSPEKVLVI